MVGVRPLGVNASGIHAAAPEHVDGSGKDAATPALHAAHFRVEFAGEGILDRQQ